MQHCMAAMMDKNLYNIEQQVASWVSTARGKVEGATSGFAIAYYAVPRRTCDGGSDALHPGCEQC